jgi:hypothetical protein
MRLYVWEDVLQDYTSGIAFALAESEEQARGLIWECLGLELDACVEPGLHGPPTHVLDLGSPRAFALWGG